LVTVHSLSPHLVHGIAYRVPNLNLNSFRRHLNSVLFRTTYYGIIIIIIIIITM